MLEIDIIDTYIYFSFFQKYPQFKLMLPFFIYTPLAHIVCRGEAGNKFSEKNKLENGEWKGR